MTQKSNAAPESWTVLSMLQWATEYFTSHHVDQPRLSIEWLLADVLGIPRLNLYLQFDRPLTSHELDSLRPMVKRRAAHEPLQYINGKAAFMSRDFVVTPAVLIPRPETEELAAMILKEHADYSGSATGLFSVLDIGTGSGCIITTLACERPGWGCYGMDISEGALDVARQNAGRFGANVKLSKMDLFELAGETVGGGEMLAGGEPSRGETSNRGEFPSTFDLIVSNPPYIHPDEAATMDPQVLKYEPEVALFASNPLDVYEAIFIYAAKVLSENGQLYLELNAHIADQIMAVGHRYFSLIELRKDDGGKERFLVAKKGQ